MGFQKRDTYIHEPEKQLTKVKAGVRKGEGKEGLVHT